MMDKQQSELKKALATECQIKNEDTQNGESWLQVYSDWLLIL